MNRNDFKSMSADELWALHEEIASRLAAALTAEKSVLENRLRRLRRGIETRHATHDARSSTERRPYPARELLDGQRPIDDLGFRRSLMLFVKN